MDKEISPSASRPAVFCTKENARPLKVGRFCSGEKRVLTQSLNYQRSHCQQRYTNHYCRDRRERQLLLPPVGGGTRGVRQRSHDTLLYTDRSHAPTEHLALGVDPRPNLNLRFALDFTGAHHVDFTVE